MSALDLRQTYCYFAGMTFAVAGILGHNTKTLLLFFLPQFVNFLYSLPQLFKLIPCPRHRMPAYIPQTDHLCNSFCEFEPRELTLPGRLVYRFCVALRLAKIEHVEDSPAVRMSNLTLINYVLYVFGPMHEATLTMVLLAIQLITSGFALLVRYPLARLFYDVVC